MQKNIINSLPDPIIICGMHRSGTSLISKTLTEMGVFMGNDIEVNHEAISFLLLNDTLLKYAHSYWDQIEGAFPFFENQEAVYQATELIKNKYFNKSFLKSYSGKNKIQHIMWGWKDPRNTITFPLWKSVFPKAKFLFIYRNGIDSVASLVNREQKQDFDITIPAYSSRCMNLDSAFGLWNDYNRFFLNHKKLIDKENLLEIKYEDFLNQPAKFLRKIVDFTDLTVTDDNINNISDKINKSRAYSFKDDKELVNFYASVKNNETMIQLGYNNLIDE